MWRLVIFEEGDMTLIGVFREQRKAMKYVEKCLEKLNPEDKWTDFRMFWRYCNCNDKLCLHDV